MINCNVIRIQWNDTSQDTGKNSGSSSGYNSGGRRQGRKERREKELQQERTPMSSTGRREPSRRREEVRT